MLAGWKDGKILQCVKDRKDRGGSEREGEEK
jgi:hypothetical protein